MDEKDLLADYGKLQLEREVHVSRLQATENLMMRVKTQIIQLKREEEIKEAGKELKTEGLADGNVVHDAGGVGEAPTQ